MAAMTKTRSDHFVAGRLFMRVLLLLSWTRRLSAPVLVTRLTLGSQHPHHAALPRITYAAVVRLRNFAQSGRLVVQIEQRATHAPGARALSRDASPGRPRRVLFSHGGRDRRRAAGFGRPARRGPSR